MLEYKGVQTNKKLKRTCSIGSNDGDENFDADRSKDEDSKPVEEDVQAIQSVFITDKGQAPSDPLAAK